MKRIVCSGAFLLVLTAMLGLIVPAWGQEVTASILGTVTDPSGAPINGAEVKATSIERGTSFTAKTNDTGLYNITRLHVGSYKVEITAQGFQRTVYPPFPLVLNQTARIDAQMKVGQVTETVEVTGAAPILQTETTEVSSIIDSTSTDKLPLATRNYVQLTLLSPGAIHPSPTSFNNGDNTASGARPYINGNREQANNFLLDGLDNNQVSDNLLGYTPAPDAIQEFNLITNNASAEFGNFQGGIVSTTLKSGTNSFHGDVWEYFRNDKLNSNSWENRFNGKKRNPLRWNMFGGTIGGPIVKNRLFFFADYQGQRFDHPSSTNSFTVFTDAERNGDFSAICTTGFTGGICNDRNKDGQVTHQLYNPCPGSGGAPCTPGTFVATSRTGSPFLNNQIPVSMIDPVASALFASQFYPTPANANFQANAFNVVTQAFNTNQFDIKGDFVATQNDHIFGRYSHAKQNNPSVNSLAIIGQGFSEAPINSEVLDWTHTFSPSLLNDLRFGVNYIKLHNGTTFPNSIGNLATELGIANGNPIGPGLMSLNFNGGTPSQAGSGRLNSVGASGIEQNFRTAVIQFSDNVVITHGHHVIHTGFDYRRNRVNAFYSGNSGKYGAILFSGQYTASDGTSPFAGSGYGAADFFLGMPNSYGHGIAGGGWHQRQSVIAGYVQDQWHITDSLTLDLGLRYEAFTPWVEVNDLQVNATLFGGQIIAPNCAKLGTIPFSCQKASRGLYDGTYGGPAFQPRIGFAWSPKSMNGRTVLRGAFTTSTYMEGTGTNLRLTMNVPVTAPEILKQFDGATAPTATSEGIVAPPPGDPFAGALFRMWDPHVQPALTEQWNLTIQQQLNPSTTVQVGYVGQHGTHLMVPMPYLQKQLLPNSSCTAPPCVVPSAYLAGNPALQSDLSQVSGTASVGSMKYHALQAVLQKRYSSGLQYQVAYTFSKCTTDNSGYYGTWGSTETTPANPYYQNLYNPAADYAECYFDAKHVVSAYAVYDLPFGKGRRFGSNMNPVVNAVVGNWSISPIISLHTGFPLALYDFGDDQTKTGSRGLRPNCGPGAGRTFGRRNAFDATTGAYIGYQYFDPSPYAKAPVGEFGNCAAQGPVRGPGYANVDLSVQKDFHITETMKFQFRADFLNAFNRVNLNAPATALGGNMGLVNTSQDPRNIQLALKFYF